MIGQRPRRRCSHNVLVRRGVVFRGLTLGSRHPFLTRLWGECLHHPAVQCPSIQGESPGAPFGDGASWCLTSRCWRWHGLLGRLLPLSFWLRSPPQLPDVDEESEDSKHCSNLCFIVFLWFCGFVATVGTVVSCHFHCYVCGVVSCCVLVVMLSLLLYL